MICPKCGFEQPDDIYCASCGVDIDRFARHKKKKLHRSYLILAFIGIAAVAVAMYAKFPQDSKVPGLADNFNEKKNVSQNRSSPSAGSLSPDAASNAQDDFRGKSSRVQTRPPMPSSTPHSLDVSSREPAAIPTGRREEIEVPEDKSPETYTAHDWLVRGTALDDESEAEVECYKKAIQLEPTMAPAHFRLGAIQYRRANYDLADQSFTRFLEHATEADKLAYNIYVYYSPSDVERLIAPEATEPTHSEDAGAGPPAETEEAEGAADSENEDLAEEGAPEIETEPEDSEGEESQEEAGEEVNTIVRFQAYDGHIVVPVLLNGTQDAHVLVDTGSSITVLSSDIADRLGLEGETGKGVTLRTMAADIEAGLVMLSSIQVGDFVQRNLPVAVTSLPSQLKGDFDGILGMDFMNHYKIRIDNQNQKIVFSPSGGGG
jgi:clan AA aspartic protease (TIGR02281 family)